jgi:hypothetical protein
MAIANSLDGAAKRLELRLQRLASGMSGSVEVGFEKGATYDDGMPVAQVAFWNEYGTRKIPARPFFRTMLAKQANTLPKSLAKYLKETGFQGEKTLNIIGQKLQDELVVSIRNWTTPPNAPYTINKKGFNKPLVDTAHMMRSVSFKVSND